MELRLRPYRDEDLPRRVEIGNRIAGEARTGVEDVRSFERLWDSGQYARWRLVVTDADGMLLGWGQVAQIPWRFHPHRYDLSLEVDPTYQGRGIGSALYERLVAEVLAQGAERLRAGTQESRIDSVRFLARRGFVELDRSWESRLDLTDFDLARFADAAARSFGPEVVITTLAEEAPRSGNAGAPTDPKGARSATGRGTGAPWEPT